MLISGAEHRHILLLSFLSAD